MREIRFRGKRIDNGEWVYGNSLNLGNRHFIIPTITNGSWSKDRLSLKFISPCYEVDPTVGQYTGLHDRNGREIWEGDIVHCRAGEIYNGISEYDAVFLVEYGWTQSMWEMQQCETIEVIGNIYDNPDLLGEEA
jgi:uncharacterized phage protein (TIGR01671 family)